MFSRIYAVSIGVASAALVISCSRGEPGTAYADARHTNGPAISATSAVAKPAVRLATSPTGNAVRYRVREQLMRHDFPNDAVGETKSVTGAIEFDASGKVIPQSSKFTADAGTFVSDQNRRDGYVRARLLEADQYPTITLVPTDVRGVKFPLPTSGTSPFEMSANLTVHGVTRPTAWNGTVRFQDGRLPGAAATAFTFADIQLQQPRVPVLLSVADTIRLEIDFDLVKQ
jgi:polyisoprenoid-binding protein YceI